MKRDRLWFLSGLFLTTLATLALETLDTRLLSVLTWYHLSFFAVSVAMLGMAAGAVTVYLGRDRFENDRARRALAGYARAFAISIPLSHLVNVSVPLVNEVSTNGTLSLFITSVALASPFYLSGVVVTLALTRIPGPIGAVYAVDLLGAALGSLLVVPLLATDNITTAILLAGALAALGALSFEKWLGRPAVGATAVLAVALGALAIVNGSVRSPVRILFPKGEYRPTAAIQKEDWTIHGQVVQYRHEVGQPPLWSAISPPTGWPLTGSTLLLVDGHAGTRMTAWDGNPASLDWTQRDVTSLPYHIRPRGKVAVIGVGGGRDVLTAIAAGSTEIQGIEINSAFTELLKGRGRDYAKIVGRPGVEIVHDEARSFLTRSPRRYDVIQMSLIDTWAATGAGAFTLSENGLYTVEAWQVFLSRLEAGGVLSVSRFFAEADASETSRLMALATAALLRSGSGPPEKNLALISLGNLATLLVSNQPLSARDLDRLRQSAADYRFRLLLMPGAEGNVALLERIAQCRSESEIQEVVKDERFDYTPPTDERPYFFNLLKPSQLLHPGALGSQQAGVISGNLTATVTLGILLLVVAVLVLAVIIGPLIQAGYRGLAPRQFGAGVVYFGLIGTGFMLTQIGFMQRFSVYLGHPTYAVVIVLFSMILATGAGSALSDRIGVESGLKWVAVMPVATALVLLAVALLIPSVTERTVEYGLAIRALLTCALVVPLSAMLGTFFPLGMRLLGRLSPEATAWMWGINGATGVLASVIAVAVSMWSGIRTNFFVALAAYALVALPAWLLSGGRKEPATPPGAP
ncbi:MAG: class I SAM-dependent methyltransferase [Polyangiaceae bacterium]|nr:class I SAM-dependent methyltransferase [Polyangiaceae bacterium]